MCGINPKHTKILRFEFFTSHEMSQEKFEELVAMTALNMEMLANREGSLRCHIHEQPNG